MKESCDEQNPSFTSHTNLKMNMRKLGNTGEEKVKNKITGAAS